MTRREGKTASATVKDILLQNPDGLREMIRAVMQEGARSRDGRGLERTERPTHANMKSTNMLERFSEEIRRRTYVVRIFHHAGSCLCLVRTLAVENHENRFEANRYIDMDDLKEHKKLMLKTAA